MSKAIGIIFCNYHLNSLEGLTNDCPVAAVPFGGRNRLLDFALSNMVNSGIKKVGMIIPYHCRPILDHIGAGKDWFVYRKTGGLFILPGATHGFYSENRKFVLKDIIENIEFLERHKAEHVAISGCSNIVNINFTEVLRHHEESQADITLVYKDLTLELEEDPLGVIIETNKNEQLRKLDKAEGKEGQKVKYFTDMFIIKRSFLLDIIKGHKNIEYIDILDVIRENIPHLIVRTYRSSGYFGRIYSLQSYFQRSMELLQPSIQNELFIGEHSVLTRIKDNPPTKYGPYSMIRYSLIASDCNIQGSVSGSIIFHGVKVEAGSSITNSILMEHCVIGRGVVLENVIIDKYATIHPRNVIKGKQGHPLFINKSKVI